LREAVLLGETVMNTQDLKDERIRREANDPPPDYSREDATFERERARLAKDHLGKIAVIHGDDVVGIYDNVDLALFSLPDELLNAQLIFCEITPFDEPIWIGNVDPNYPCV
jgi:hypothetical protein